MPGKLGYLRTLVCRALVRHHDTAWIPSRWPAPDRDGMPERYVVPNDRRGPCAGRAAVGSLQPSEGDRGPTPDRRPYATKLTRRNRGRAVPASAKVQRFDAQ